MPRFATLIFAAASFCIAWAFTSAEAQTSDDAAAIRETIQSQLSAMQSDDWAEAFTYASPTIQGVFQSPEAFSRMVIGGYPMVHRPRSFKVGDLTDSPRGPVQVMFFEDQEGRLFIADYLMQLVDGEWRINGVAIRPAPEQTV
ncbi:MAG: DUF4864 domain-containing protein [Pseudomonadota bacterium]